MRLTVIALLISSLAGLHAAHSATVWVPGHWGQSACGEQQWVQGSYCTQPATVVVQQPAQVIVVPPAPVWVAGGWVWSNDQWVWRDGYWSVPPASHPQPVYQAQPVYVQPACPRPRVSIGVGIGLGHHGGHHDHGRHHNNAVPAIPFVPGSHALPRPPKHFPDPLGLFRHDPLGLLKRH